MGLGSAEQVTLAEARALAAEARRHVAAGRDPIEERERERRAAAAPPPATFEAAARALVAAKAAGWRSPSTPGNGSRRWNGTPSR
jgi:hypothetical protein